MHTSNKLETIIDNLSAWKKKYHEINDELTVIEVQLNNTLSDVESTKRYISKWDPKEDLLIVFEKRRDDIELLKYEKLPLKNEADEVIKENIEALFEVLVDQKSTAKVKSEALYNGIVGDIYRDFKIPKIMALVGIEKP